MPTDFRREARIAIDLLMMFDGNEIRLESNKGLEDWKIGRLDDCFPPSFHPSIFPYNF